jgi:hypothetical protein
MEVSALDGQPGADERCAMHSPQGVSPRCTQQVPSHISVEAHAATRFSTGAATGDNVTMAGWRRLREPSKQELSWLRRMRRMKLYADEDIEDPVVGALRGEGINIVSARELGHRGKPDSFHAAWAFKHKRFLVTRNAKHFLDERLVPFHPIYGVIALTGDMRDLSRYAKALVHLTDVVPYAEIYAGAKIQLSAERIIVRCRADDGSIIVYQARYDRSGAYVWQE